MLTSQHVLCFGINPLLCLKTGLWNDMSQKYFNHLRRNICIYAFSWISRRGFSSGNDEDIQKQNKWLLHSVGSFFQQMFAFPFPIKLH